MLKKVDQRNGPSFKDHGYFHKENLDTVLGYRELMKVYMIFEAGPTFLNRILLTIFTVHVFWKTSNILEKNVESINLLKN